MVTITRTGGQTEDRGAELKGLSLMKSLLKIFLMVVHSMRWIQRKYLCLMNKIANGLNNKI